MASEPNEGNEKPSASIGIVDVPSQIFDAFLKTLAEAETAEIVVERLKNTLLEEAYTERALTTAIFGEEPLQ